jgi:hypothetical protein
LTPVPTFYNAVSEKQPYRGWLHESRCCATAPAGRVIKHPVAVSGRRLPNPRTYCSGCTALLRLGAGTGRLIDFSRVRDVRLQHDCCVLAVRAANTKSFTCTIPEAKSSLGSSWTNSTDVHFCAHGWIRPRPSPRWPTASGSLQICLLICSQVSRSAIRAGHATPSPSARLRPPD